MIDIPKHKVEERENLQKKIEEYFKAGKEPEKAKPGQTTEEQIVLNEAEKYRFNKAKCRI